MSPKAADTVVWILLQIFWYKSVNLFLKLISTAYNGGTLYVLSMFNVPRKTAFFCLKTELELSFLAENKQ